MPRPSRVPARKDDDLDLPLLEGDLPPLDGDDEGDEGGALEELPLLADDGDPLDDATGEDEPVTDEIDPGGGEEGWLLDAEDAETLDVGAFDLSLPDSEGAADDEEPVAVSLDDELGAFEESVLGDAGEEGPLADDEELREEDLPALDADDDGEVDEAALFDPAALEADEELRWDDRAWAAVSEAEPDEELPSDESGPLLSPGDDPAQEIRDAVWRRLDEGGRLTAAALVPGDGVVVALEETDGRARLVRIRPDGQARIIAEIDAPDGEEARVRALRWDPVAGVLRALGSFGALSFRPA